MTGGASLPLSLVAVFFGNEIVKIILVVTALFCAWLASYRIWKRERGRVIDLEERIQSKLHLSFEPKDPWIKTPIANVPMPPAPRGSVTLAKSDNVIRTKSCQFRLLIKNDSPISIAHGCRVHLTDVEFSGDVGVFQSTGFGVSQPLRWSETTIGLYDPKDIALSQKCFVDIFFTDELYRSISIAWPDEWIANERLFDRTGMYRLTIAAASEDAGSKEIKLILGWNGQWDQTTLRTE